MKSIMNDAFKTTTKKDQVGMGCAMQSHDGDIELNRIESNKTMAYRGSAFFANVDELKSLISFSVETMLNVLSEFAVNSVDGVHTNGRLSGRTIVHVVHVGRLGKSYEQNVVFHRDAFGDGEKKQRQKKHEMSVRLCMVERSERARVCTERMCQFGAGLGDVSSLGQIVVDVFGATLADQRHFGVAVVVRIILTNANQLALVSRKKKQKTKKRT